MPHKQYVVILVCHSYKCIARAFIFRYDYKYVFITK